MNELGLSHNVFASAEESSAIPQWRQCCEAVHREGSKWRIRLPIHWSPDL